MNTSLDKRKVAKSFSRASTSYEEVAVVQKTVLDEHIDRLSVTQIEPEKILDIGSGTGTGGQALLQKYKKSKLIAMDISEGMLEQHRKKLSRFKNRTDLVCADLDFLPLADKSFDLVFSNLAFQWSNDLNQLISETHRVLRTGGLLSFTTVGPDTLKELRGVWHSVDQGVHIHDFVDMHEIGDVLISNGFGAPVLDVDRYTLTYPDLKMLMMDLKKLGATNASSDRAKGMLCPSTLKKVKQAYEKLRVGGKLPLTYEIVYAHAWLPAENHRPQDGSTVSHFPVSEIKRRSS